jgi:hypothetical protein
MTTGSLETSRTTDTLRAATREDFPLAGARATVSASQSAAIFQKRDLASRPGR